MKTYCFLLGFVLSCFSPSNVMAEDFNFSGQFTEGSSYSAYHSFTLSSDSLVDISINSTCDVSNIILGIDDDNSNFFDDTLVQADVENSTWYGVYPLAGEKTYRVRLQCSPNNQESYDITVRYSKYFLTSGSTGGIVLEKDVEPNNNKNTATQVPGSIQDMWLEGHLGFLFDTHEAYNNDTRDGLDYYRAALEPGIYGITMMRVGRELLKHSPYVPSLRISNKDTEEVVLLEDLVEGATHEIYVSEYGIYSFSVVSSKVVTSYTDMPYGGYYIVFGKDECPLKLENLQVEDNVCGNTETVGATLTNPCPEKWYGTIRVKTTITGPAYNEESIYREWDIELEPGGRKEAGGFWHIPETVFTGQYKSCIEVKQLKNDPPSSSDIDDDELWEDIDTICKEHGVMCNKNAPQAGMMLLLLKRWSWENN